MDRGKGVIAGGVKQRSYSVIISEHAYNRWLERGGPALTWKELTGLTRAKVNNAMAVGISIDPTGAGWIEVIPGIWAIVELHSIGWIVKTFRNRVEKAG